MAQQHLNTSSPNDGLGDPLRTANIKCEANFTELYANKVDKVAGKGLSDTNFTQTEKDKLAGLAEGGQLQTDWDQGDNTKKDYLKNKPLNTSDFNNDGAGTQPFIEDTGVVGIQGRSQGEWIDISLKIFDGIIGITSGFTVGQVAFTLPSAMGKCFGVYINGVKQYKTTVNNGTITGRWSQTSNVVTITKTTVLNNYIYIEYQ